MFFSIGLALLLGALLLLSLAIVLAWHFLPPAFVQHCFNLQHFTAFELDFLASHSRLTRTAALMRLAACPGSGRRRGLEDAHLLAPRWFVWFSRIVLPLYVALIAGLLLHISVPLVLHWWRG